MKNRPRPPIPTHVKVAVALRQCQQESRRTELWMVRSGDQSRPEPFRLWLNRLLWGLCVLRSCHESDLALDHDPPLRVRKFNERRFAKIEEEFKASRITTRERWRKIAACYEPSANDPEHLRYRDDHHIKTNVRGDHGQHPDRVLIKRERRRERKASEKAAKPRLRKRKPGTGRIPNGHAKLRSRPFPKGHRPLSRWRPNR